MKKIILSMFVAVAAVTGASSVVLANSSSVGNQYIDTNNDGVCDNNKEESQKQNNYIDTNNDGVCDNKEESQKQYNYTDANNDGICDNMNRNTCTKGKGCHIRKQGMKNRCAVNKK